MQEFDDIASPEDSMSNGELERLGRREIWSQNALLDAAAAEDLAGGAGAEDHRRRRGRRRLRSGWGTKIGGGGGGRRDWGVR